MIGRIKHFLDGIEQASNLGHRCAALEKENSDLRAQCSEYRASFAQKEREVSALGREYVEFKAKLRAQTEADLVLTSLKIIQGAIRGETKEQLSSLASMQAQQMRAMQGISPQYGSGLGQALFGSVFGG